MRLPVSDNRKVNMYTMTTKGTSLAAALCLALLASPGAGGALYAQDAAVQGEGQVTAVAAGEVPLLLEGIWQNDSRYVVFDTHYISSATGGTVPNVVLRTFYQWYNDRAAESSAYTAEHSPDRNDTVPAVPEQMELHFTPLTDQLFTSAYNMPVTQADGDQLTAEQEPSGAWDVEIRYAGKKIGGERSYHVPVAVIGNKLYLNFAIKKEDSDSVPQGVLLDGITIQSGNLLGGYWQDAGNANGILISPPVTSNELLSYYVADGAVYHIRYWRTDMDYDADALAEFTDGDRSYSVPKMIASGGKTYTCTLGRRTKIRNIDKSKDFPQKYTSNSVLVEKKIQSADGTVSSYTVRTSTICAFGEPYLTLTEGTRTLEEIVAEQNARRKPPAPSPFPPHGVLDFDWSIVEDPPASWDRRMLDLGK